MQSSGLDSQPLPTLPAIAALLPGGTLRAGVSYAVGGQLSLALALLAGVSRDGLWCGVLGVPGFGVEAAERAGIDLDRLVLVPDAGPRWVEVAAALADAVTVLIVAEPPRLPDSERARLDARLRQRGSTMIVLGQWPRAEAELRVEAVRWRGIGLGFGMLAGHDLRVAVRDRRGRSNSGVLGFDSGGAVADFTPDAVGAARRRVAGSPRRAGLT